MLRIEPNRRFRSREEIGDALKFEDSTGMFFSKDILILQLTLECSTRSVGITTICKKILVRTYE